MTRVRSVSRFSLLSVSSSRQVSANRFGGMAGTLLVSLTYDITKNYSIIWPVCAVSMAFTLVAALGCMKLSRNKMAQEMGREQPS